MIRSRLIGLILVLFGVTILSFLLSNLSSIDQAEAYARNTFLHPTPEQIEEIRVEMGFHLPLHQQYFNWLSNSLQGDLGTSVLTRNQVTEDIAQKLPATMLLVGMALLWIILLSIPIGLICALKKDSFFDHLVRGGTILGASLPNFWLAFLLLFLLAVSFPIFRVVDYGNIKSLILPSFVLALPVACLSIRLFRATILSNLNEDYIVYAKARGIRTSRIVWGHVLKNSLPPIVTLFFQYIGNLIAGSAIVESIFSLKGIGMHLVDAILARDLPTINGCVLIIALIFVCSRSLAEVINMLLNPSMVEREEILL
ncbi:ABC transporter permease [Bacillus horti]|uniref:ABC-type dipeptide/oligopeptide/nickel transport system permease component n=1 Tax=Caldalkalibacillus horti TaxID=77523 RepID=A0ABT9VZW4_9BACI|nr:ABC transporter permease [Bacillus horti]MDQ0166516.1 ABC-type dipeptide/oligopeptide/nickel transport system permease component [Bacillus horti]